jgi:membrane dipeptidase
MVNYATPYISDAYRRWQADEAAEKMRFNAPPYGGLYIGQPDKAAAAMADWYKAHPRPHVAMSEVVDHIVHIAQVAGVDHVGLGSDYDGVGEQLPEGMADVSTYPTLLAELMKRGWSDEDIRKVAGENVLRVMARAEAVAASMAGQLPETKAM